MANEKKVVLVACGTGIATSTVVNTALESLAKDNGIQIEIIQCKIMEVPSYADRADLLITSSRSSMDAPSSQEWVSTRRRRRFSPSFKNSTKTVCSGARV